MTESHDPPAPGPTEVAHTRGYISLPSVARRLPPHRGGRAVHPTTVMRWVIRGVRLPDGSRVRLRAESVGSRWLTTEECFRAFIDAQTAARTPDPRALPAPQSLAQRRRAAERAGRELDRYGI